MKLFIVTLIMGVCSAGRLEQTYLPPSSSLTAGGNGNLLSAPVSNQYLPPQENSNNYDENVDRQYLPPQESSEENYDDTISQYPSSKSVDRQYLPPQNQKSSGQHSASQYSSRQSASSRFSQRKHSSSSGYSSRNQFAQKQTTFRASDRQYLPPQNDYARNQYSSAQSSASSRQYLPPQQSSNGYSSSQTSRQYLPPSQSSNGYSSAQSSRQYLPPSQSSNGYSSSQTSRQYLPPSQSSNGYSSAQSSRQYLPPSQNNNGYSTTPVPILKYNNEPNYGEGTYEFEYETGNGIMQKESGHLENAGSENEEEVVEGSYSYTGPDGVVYTVNYRADANGFQASGDHLPSQSAGKSGYSSGQSRKYLPPQRSSNGNSGYNY